MRRSLFPLLGAALLLTACGPHPSAGEWRLAPGGTALYSRIRIDFDGTAFLFAPGRDEHQVRCFWAGADRDAINLDCVVNDASERRLAYRLKVTSGSDSLLYDNGNEIGRYVRDN